MANYFPLVLNNGQLQQLRSTDSIKTNISVDFPALSLANYPTTPSGGFRLFANSSGKLSWIGTNGFVRTFDGTANTGDRAYVLPDASGTIALVAGSNQQFIFNDNGSYNGSALLTVDKTNNILKIGSSASNKLGFYGVTSVNQRVNIPSTAGASISQLETELNKIKQLLVDVGLMAAPAGAAITFLDTYYADAKASYSLTKRRSTASYAIRARRSSDNSEQDIGFTGTSLDVASLLTFCGSGSGYITTLYDQTGNGNNATQTTASKQARIVNAGVVETLSSFYFDGIDDSYDIPTLGSFTEFGIISVLRNVSDPATSGSNSGIWLFGASGSSSHHPFTDGVIYEDAGSATRFTVGNPAPSMTNTHLYSISSKPNNWNCYLNGNLLYNSTVNTVSVASSPKIGAGGVAYFNGKIMEIVILNNLTNFSEIQALVNYNYSIY